jgi:dipeptidyl-peptidase-3
LKEQELEAFLDYAATFLSNIGNYYVSARLQVAAAKIKFLIVSQGSGDQKFVPSTSSEALEPLASRSSQLKSLFEKISPAMFTVPPYGLGFPSEDAQSAYYPGPMAITQSEIAVLSQALEERKVWPENTRIRKLEASGSVQFEVLLASVEDDIQPPTFLLPDSHTVVSIKRGDHAEELAQVCSNLSEAIKYADNDIQRKFLSEYIQSFRTGDLEVYRNSQRAWIMDKGPRVENIFGFVEPYRDPYGIRVELHPCGIYCTYLLN